MFGLEKKKNKPVFVFDLEKEISDEHKQDEMKKKVEQHIHQIKDQLRKGANAEEFEKLGILLHGYSALLKILTRAPNK